MERVAVFKTLKKIPVGNCCQGYRSGKVILLFSFMFFGSRIHMNRKNECKPGWRVNFLACFKKLTYTSRSSLCLSPDGVFLIYISL